MLLVLQGQMAQALVMIVMVKMTVTAHTARAMLSQIKATITLFWYRRTKRFIGWCYIGVQQFKHCRNKKEAYGKES